jgi:hypothetical protein
MSRQTFAVTVPLSPVMTFTTFAVVAGAAGANLDETVVIILGGANLLADGFSMGVSNFLGTRAARQQRERARREEQLHTSERLASSRSSAWDASGRSRPPCTTRAIVSGTEARR